MIEKSIVRANKVFTDFVPAKGSLVFARKHHGGNLRLTFCIRVGTAMKYLESMQATTKKYIRAFVTRFPLLKNKSITSNVARWIRQLTLSIDHAVVSRAPVVNLSALSCS